MKITRDASLYLGVDVGTTSTKALVLDTGGTVYGRGQASYRLYSPQPGHHVQDATEWQGAVIDTTRAACADIDPTRIEAIAISAQGGTLVALDRDSRPLCPARSWLDRRATRSARRFEHVFGREDFYRRTGWPIAPNNTAAQLLDLASNDPDVFASATCFCDTAAYVNGWLTGTPTIDSNVAGIGQLVDVGSESWDEEILATIGVGPERLPLIAQPGTRLGTLTEDAADALGLSRDTIVAAGAHDQYCAALGVGAIQPNDLLLSTGTAWVMLAVATKPYGDPAGGIGSGRHFLDELWGHFGEVSNGGLSMEWAGRLRGGSGHAHLESASLDAALATTSPGADGLSFFPFFDGTSPDDTSETSRGSMLGLALTHDHRHLLRAVAEGVAFAMRMLLEGYWSFADRRTSLPVVAGGATRSTEWIQLLAQILGTDLLVSAEPNAACLGAAILAAIAIGEVPDARSGADRMGSSTGRVVADPSAAHEYDQLFRTYERHAHGLSELYSEPAGVAGRKVS
jgi:xylulokinase